MVRTGPVEMYAGLVVYTSLCVRVLTASFPSSFEGQHGSVRHYVKDNIVRDWNWDYMLKQKIMAVLLL